MRFDTRNKKPKLWNLLVQLLFGAGIVFAMIADGAHKYILPISVLVDVFILLSIVQLIVAFFRQLQYNPYSYNTIYYFGFALFLIAVLIMEVLVTFALIRNPEEYQLTNVLSTLTGSAQTYMILSAPFILIFSLSLCISNIVLLRHEGRSYVNILGILLSFCLIAGELFLWRYDYYATGSQFEVMMHDIGTNAFAVIYLYFECMMIGTIAADLIAARYEPEYDKDYVIILGCGLCKDGTPTPLLKGRCDRALEFARRQKEKTGKDVIFVTSGGQGEDEVISESASMANYLMEQGIPKERILQEDRSVNTQENMRFSKEKIMAQNPDARIAFSTTNYHVFRSGIFARRVKMRAVGMGAKTKWYFWPNAAVREFIGLLSAHRVKQALIIISLLVCYIAMTVWYYHT